MGFLKQPKEQEKEKDEPFLKVKVTLAAADEFDIFFCAIDFSSRKFAIVKMLSDTQPGEDIKQFMFTELKTVQSLQKA